MKNGQKKTFSGFAVNSVYQVSYGPLYKKIVSSAQLYRLEIRSRSGQKTDCQKRFVIGLFFVFFGFFASLDGLQESHWIHSATAVEMHNYVSTSNNLLLDLLDLQHLGCVTVNILHFASADFFVQFQASSSLAPHPSVKSELDWATLVTNHQVVRVDSSSVSYSSGNVNQHSKAHFQTRCVERVTSGTLAVQSSSLLFHVGQPLLPVVSHSMAGDGVSPFGSSYWSQRLFGFGAVHLGLRQRRLVSASSLGCPELDVEMQDLLEDS